LNLFSAILYECTLHLRIQYFFALKNLLLFISLFASYLPLSAQWRSANAFTGSISDIFFPDRLTGYACSVAGGIGNCSGTGSILRTIDGGENWVRMNTASNAAMTRLHFVDKFTGWAVGATSTIQKTIDGGQTWTLQSSGIGAGLNDIHFPTLTTGFVVGLNGIVRKSINGGTSWTTIESGSTTLTSVWFVDANIGFYCSNNGKIFKTVNGGTSFSSVYSGSELLKDIWFADAQNGYALSNNKILKTTNGGSSWQSINAPTGSIWLRMNFSSVNHGYIFGDLNQILKTTDGGLTWQQIPSEFNAPVTCGFFLDEQNGYVAGSLCRISKTTNGGQTWNNLISGLSRIYGISYRDPETAILVGTAGTVYRTKNSSLTHKRIKSGTNVLLTAVKWLDNQTLVACGDSGVVMRSADAGFTWNLIPTPTTNFLSDLWSPSPSTVFVCGFNGTILESSDAGLTWTLTTIPTAQPFKGIHFYSNSRGMVAGGNVVYRTTDGGLTWELKVTDILNNTSFNDVWVANDTLAYAAGTFGKYYCTKNGGEAWEAIWPSGTNNAEINEMVFINDTVGYFARLGSQSYTGNGGLTIGSQSTYCLANNGGIDAIDILNTPAGVYGSCSGGSSNVYHTVAPDSLASTYLQDSIFCSGSRIFVGYLATGLLFNSEIVTAQLSDATGSFANPTTLSSYTIANPAISPSGIITCTLPSGLNGTGFRIRVVCISRSFISPDNGYNIRIQSSIQPSISLIVNPPAACGGDDVLASVQGSGLGTNPIFSWTLNGQILELESPTIELDTLSVASSLSVVVTSNLTCASPLTSAASTNIAISESPSANAGDDISICGSETAQIGSPNLNSVSWFPTTTLSDPNSAQPITSATETTQYILTVTNTAGCSSSDTVLVQVNPVPLSPVISLAGGELIITGNPQGTIIWYRNGEIIEDENNDTLLITATGDYQVYFEDAIGCSSISNVITITTVGISTLNLGFYPSVFVSDNSLIIEGLPKSFAQAKYQLFDLSGRLLANGVFTNSEGLANIITPTLSAGIYFIQISDPSYQTALKFIHN